jgi:hypothetical protein
MVKAIRNNFTARLKAYLKTLVGIVYLILGKPGLKSLPVVFVIHEVADQPFTHSLVTNTYCSEKVFKVQMDFIRSNFNFISLQLDDLRLPKQGCLMTFDDGYASSKVVTETYLFESHIQSLHFWNPNTLKTGINVSSVEHLNSLLENRRPEWANSNPSLKFCQESFPNNFAGPFLTLEQARDFSTQGLVLIGDHGREHFYSPSLSRDEFIANLSFPINEINSNLNFLPLWAAPHSAINDEVVETLSELGCKIVFGGSQYFQFGNTQVIPRIDLNESLNTKFRILGVIAITFIRHYLWSIGNKKEVIRFRG